MFRFRLQRLLDLRQKAEQAKARELAEAQDAAEQAREQRDALARLEEASREEIARTHDALPRVGHLHQLGMVLQSLEQRVEVAHEQVNEAENIVSGARQALEQAARNRKVLDRLKEKQADMWRTGEQQRDRQLMDEIALNRFARGKEETP